MNSMNSLNISRERWTEIMALANVAINNGDMGRGEALLLQAYESGTRIFGADHGAVGLVLMRLATVCRLTRRDELAEKYEAEADDILQSYVLDH